MSLFAHILSQPQLFILQRSVKPLRPISDFCAHTFSIQHSSLKYISFSPSNANITCCFPAYGLTHTPTWLPAHCWWSRVSTYCRSWCTRPSQSPCCRWPGGSRWCWLARSHTCGAGCPWRAGDRWGQRRSGRRRSGSSHPKASSQTGSGRPQWSSGLGSSHAHTYTNHAGDTGDADASGGNLWSFYFY